MGVVLPIVVAAVAIERAGGKVYAALADFPSIIVVELGVAEQDGAGLVDALTAIIVEGGAAEE